MLFFNIIYIYMASFVLSNILSSIMRKGVSKTFEEKRAQARQLYKGKIDQLSPPNQEIVNKYGDDIIIGIVIKRTPLPKLFTQSVNYLVNEHFDRLFHLYIELTLTNGARILLEKNERITLSVNPQERKDSESETVSIFPAQLTLNEILVKTASRMGRDAFYSYNAGTNNCQDFILNVFDANEIGDSQDRAFIKQDLNDIAKKNPLLTRIAEFITNTGAFGRVTLEGGNLGKNKISTNNIEMDFTHLHPNAMKNLLPYIHTGRVYHMKGRGLENPPPLHQTKIPDKESEGRGLIAEGEGRGLIAEGSGLIAEHVGRGAEGLIAEGTGLKKAKKGSQEMKDKMAKLRAMRKNKK